MLYMLRLPQILLVILLSLGVINSVLADTKTPKLIADRYILPDLVLNIPKPIACREKVKKSKHVSRKFENISHDIPKAKAKLLHMIQQKYDFDIERVRQIVFALNFEGDILKYTKKQPESTLSYDTYRNKIALTKERTQAGLKFYKKYYDIIKKVESYYGVNGEVLVALMGLESFYGKYSGNYSVADVLFTLYASGYRSDFFADQLIEFIYINIIQGVPFDTKGSWAGAFGLVQFMPSTFKKFAVDFDGDGEINLYSIPDALASAANYLQAYGWIPEEILIQKYNPKKTQIDPCKFGVVDEYGSFFVYPDRQEIDAYMKSNNGKMPLEGSYYKVSSNYFTLLDWNRSLLFANSIYEFSKFLSINMI